MLRFVAEALRNTAVSQDAGRRHDPDLVEQSNLPVRTCGRRSFPDRRWHVSRYGPPYERPHRRREPDAAHSAAARHRADRKSTRLNSSHGYISYAVFCLKKKNNYTLT